MNNRLVAVRIAFLSILLFLPSLLFAFDDIYDAPGVDPHRETLSSIPEEHIDPFTGGLTFNHIDARLPGNGGLDLVIQRSFSSKNMCSGYTYWAGSWSCNVVGERTWMGYGWNLHFGRLFAKPSSSGPHVIEMPDGSLHTAYLKAGASDSITKDYWLLDIVGSTYVVTMTNGTKISFGQSFAPNNSRFPSSSYSPFLATKIEDTNGNSITINYKQFDTAHSDIVINYITDTLGRRINFYHSVINSGVYLTGISGYGIDLTYTYNSLQGQLGDALLSQAKYPLGNPWTYTYDTTLMEMKTVTAPPGGVITYSYDFSSVINGCNNISLTYRTITQKQISGTSGNWAFAYSQGTNREYTNITDPCGRTIKYSYYGYGSGLSYGDRWKYGLPKSKEIVNEESTSYSWIESASPISLNYNTVWGCAPEYGIYVPLLSSKTITRDSNTYTTSYSNYDGYGNVRTISESGDKTRTTTRTYWYSTLQNIVQNKPATENISGGFPGSFSTSYTYDENGNLAGMTKYGVATTYSYDSGNLSSTTDANQKTTTYDWTNGKISQITYPGNIYTTSRVINSNSTVASETDGRQNTTSYTYDDNLRATSIDPPAGNTTYIAYDNVNNLYKKETRGSYWIQHNNDGLGRPSGTSDSKGITTTISYKSCGLKDYTDSSIGDKVYFDDFGRTKQVVHKDSNHVDYSYSYSNVTIKDEATNSTTLTYNAFGNPDEKLLMSVYDALHNTTSYSYNILGSLTSISQGSTSRTFEYDPTTDFLKSETHPEKGSITYTRDGVGNMKTKTDALGQKTYIYDTINRLKEIDYGYDSVTFGYDNANNRTSINNPSANITYSYDSANRLTGKNETILNKSYATTYGYDGNDNLTSIGYPSGKSAGYTYDSNNQVYSASYNGSSIIDSVSYNSSGVHNGLPSGYNYGGYSPSASFAYNDRNLTTSITASSVVNMSYGYDSRGNMTSSSNGTLSQSYTYDELDRLKNFNGAWGSGSYSYDSSGFGNRSGKTVGSSTTTYSYTGNKLTSTTGGEPFSFGYNGYGDLASIVISGQQYDLTYDDLHNLISYKNHANNTSVADFAYDGDGMRVSKSSNGKTVVYHYDREGKTLSETDDQGTLIADYVYLNGRHVAKVANEPNVMDIPTSPVSYPIYAQVANPVLSSDPAAAKPVSAVISGGALTVTVGFLSFAGPVDIYLAIYAPSVDPNIYWFKPDNSLQPGPMWSAKWRANTPGPINEVIFNNIPVNGLAPAMYNLYAVVTPSGSQDAYYLWSTEFTVPISDINIYGSSSQYNFWKTVAGNFLINQGCTLNGSQESGDKKHYVVNATCGGNSTNFRVSSWASFDGPLAVQGNTTNPNRGSCPGGTPYQRSMLNSIADNTTMSCQTVTGGTSDVQVTSITQESSGQLNGPYGGGLIERNFKGTKAVTSHGLTTCRNVAMPFAFYVNKSVHNTAHTTIANLTMAQVRLIFSGGIIDWSDMVGFDPQPINVCFRHAGSGAHATLDNRVMGPAFLNINEDLSGPYHYYFNDGSVDMMNCINLLQGAVGYADADRSIGSYPNVSQVTYNGVAASKANIVWGAYDFWAVQNLYTVTPVPDNMTALCTFTQNKANVTSPYYAAECELIFAAVNDEAYPVYRGTTCP